MCFNLLQAAGGKPPSAGAKKKVVGGGKGKSKAGAGTDSKPVEALLSDETMEEKANALLGEENVGLLSNSNWKQRLAAMENIEQVRPLHGIYWIPYFIKTDVEQLAIWKSEQHSATYQPTMRQLQNLKLHLHLLMKFV